MKKVVLLFIVLGILGNIFFIPEYANKEVSEYEIIKDSIYVNKFKLVDTLRARSIINRVLEENSFGFMVESINYKEFKERKIDINMYLHGDSLFLLKNNNEDIANLFREVVSTNEYFSRYFSVNANLIFIPEDFINEKIIYQETFMIK